MATVYPFTGTVQHYAWGGYEYLPEFLHRDNKGNEPWAELWMGAHPKGPAKLTDDPRTLDELIEEAPRRILGGQVAERFSDRLPFLFKVLDVREMLSIQVHPTKKAAEKGFAAEEKSGPPRDAPDRNYRDDNHKPELGVALSDFYLLHGFRGAQAIERSLRDVPGWAELHSVLQEDGVKGLYAHVMNADQATINRLLEPLARSLEGKRLDRSDPAFWAQRAFDQYTKEGNFDRGVFSVYWFNLVHLQPGEGIFQDAGIPHAYLEGACLELMANSDNVLRGGLTPKHIDVPELMKHTRFEEVLPNKLRPERDADGWNRYPTPAPDFELAFRDFRGEDSLALTTTDGPAILLLLQGAVEAGNGRTLTEDARTAFVPAGQTFVLTGKKDGRIFRATVGR